MSVAEKPAPPAPFLAATKPLHVPDLAYRPDIDGLRAMAVLPVVAFHAFPRAAPGGFVGVDIFFVISGYLISRIILNGSKNKNFSFVEFYARRIRRIFPALIIVLVSCLAIGWFVLLTNQYALLGKHTAGAAVFLSNFLLNREAGYFDLKADHKPLLHLWSLGIEEQFYIFFPALIFVATRFRANYLLVIAVIALASFLLNVFEIGSDPVRTFYWPTTRIWELLLGCMLGYRAVFGLGKLGTGDALLIPIVSSTMSVIGGLLIAGAVIGLNSEMAYPGWWALLPTVGAALVIVAGPNALLNDRVLALRPLIYIGLISYPLYLWHWPLLSFAAIAQTGIVSLQMRLALVALAFVLAVTTYSFFEMPIRHSRSHLVTGGLVALLLTVGAVGYAIGRIPQAPLRIDNARYHELESDRLAALRAGSCYQRFEQVNLRDAFGACLALDPHRPNILILGDSTAADLWLALSGAYPDVNFVQATGAACVPLEQFDPGPKFPFCGPILNFIKHDYADLNRLDGIILSGNWRSNPSLIEKNLSLIEKEVDYYRSRNIPTAVFGPPIKFTDRVSDILARHHSQPIDRYLDTDTLALDHQMELFFRRRGIQYVSKIQTLCDEGHCPVLGDEGEPLILDAVHWTTAGARYFGSAFHKQGVIERIFGPVQRQP